MIPDAADPLSRPRGQGAGSPGPHEKPGGIWIPATGCRPAGRVSAFLLASLLPLVASCGGPFRTRSGLEVEYQGCRALSASRLWEASKSEAEDFDESRDQSRLSDACFRIVHLYELEGREGTTAEFSLERGRLVFKVEEARSFLLGKIRIEGAKEVPEEELLGALPHHLLGSSPYSDLLVRELGGRLGAIYQSRGYVDANVEKPELEPKVREHRMDLRFRVQEGRQYRVSKVEGREDLPPELARHLASLVGKPYTPRSLDEVQAAVLDYYREHGYPFVQVQAQPDIHAAEAAVVIRLELSTGAYARLGTPEAQGRRRVNESFVKSRADLEPGKEYQAADLRRAEERLAATNLFDSVRAEPGTQDEKTGLVPVVIRLEERDPGEVAVRLGYGTLDGARAGVDLRYSDILGNAEFFRVGGTVSRFGYRGEAELAFPYVLGSEYRPSISGYYETESYPSFDAVSFGEVVSVSRAITKNLSGTLGVRHAAIRTKNVEPGVPPGDLLDFSYTAPFLSFHWDERDNALLPTRGLLVDTRIEISDQAYSKDIQFWNLSGRVTYLLPLPWALTLAASFQGGLIAPTEGTQGIPISLRYFAGGTNSVRGFEFATLGPQVNGEATGGETFMALQTEVRFPIWDNLHGAVFTDRGGVWEDYRRVDLGDVRYSVGTGLRYHTPAGAIVTDFAWNPARQAGEHGWAFHFSIGFPF